MPGPGIFIIEACETPGDWAKIPFMDRLYLVVARGHSGLSVFRNAKFFQDKAQRTESRKTELEEITPDKQGEKEKIFMNKQWVMATVNAQGKTENNKKTGNGVNPIINDHGYLLG